MFVTCNLGFRFDRWGKDVGGAQEASRETARYGVDWENQEAEAGLFQSKLHEEKVFGYSSLTFLSFKRREKRK